MSGSPYKKSQGSSSQLTKNRLASVSNPAHTSEELERLKVKITDLLCTVYIRYNIHSYKRNIILFGIISCDCVLIIFIMVTAFI